MAQGTPAATASTSAKVYAPSVGTSTKLMGQRRARVGHRVKVRPVVSNGAKGTVTVTVRKGKKLVKRVTRTVRVGLVVRFKAKKKGTYKVKAAYRPAAGTPFKASTSLIKVVRVK